MKKRSENPLKALVNFNRPVKPPVMPRETLIEHLIEEAQVQGKFDNLANEGRPLKIEEENPFVPEEMRLTFKVLENAGFAPPWVELEKEVNAALLEVERERTQHRKWLNYQLADIKAGPWHLFMHNLRRLANSHEQWLKTHAEKLATLNSRIYSFNDVCPVSDLLKSPILIESVLEEYDKSCPTIPRV